MKKLFFILLCGLIIHACSRVPITDRKQVSLLPETELVAMSLAAYNDFLDTSEVLKSGKNVDLVNTVAGNISKSVEKIMKEQGYADRLSDFQWEFHVVESDQINAWCMPGGKVVVYTGILPVTKDANGLAVVLGHEIAHAVARHGNERMSQQLVAYTGFTALDIALSNKPQQTRDLLLTAVGVGATVGVLLPFSRAQESEADRLGLIFMADAGYNPNEAVGFWQRMSQNGGAEIPEFLSTHPSDETRINNIQNEYLPEAMKYYKPAK